MSCWLCESCSVCGMWMYSCGVFLFKSRFQILDSLDVFPRNQDEVGKKIEMLKATQDVWIDTITVHKVQFGLLSGWQQLIFYLLVDHSQGDVLMCATATLLRTTMELLYKLYTNYISQSYSIKEVSVFKFDSFRLCVVVCCCGCLSSIYCVVYIFPDSVMY